MRVWVEYDGVEKKIEVTLAPMNVNTKPITPLLSLSRDLSPIIKDNTYVGFSSSTGSVLTAHYVLGWSFKVNGQAPELVLSQLPKLLRIGGKPRSKFLTIGLPVMVVSLVWVAISSVIYVIRKKRKFAELLEDWELDRGPQRFKYKNLFVATKGFKEKEVLGSGGFGKVYRGVLPTSKIEIAVKRVSRESRQGMREFVAEIVSMGRLGHRNLVPLLGYCLLSHWNRGEILEARDPNLGADYAAEEVELVLKLGLLCSNSEPAARPSMRQVVQFLEGDVHFPELPSVGLCASGLKFAMSSPAPTDNAFTLLSPVADSLLSGGSLILIVFGFILEAIIMEWITPHEIKTVYIFMSWDGD